MKRLARSLKLLPWMVVSVLSASCTQADLSAEDAAEEAGDRAEDVQSQSLAIRHVFVIAMENHDASEIYGNPNAPYINSLKNSYAYATNFVDELPNLASEPHYLYMEAGRNAFGDHVFTTDNDPSASNSTASKSHLVTQLTAAGKSWMSYQEGLSSSTGLCPVVSSGYYAAKHDPFVFFQDVAGNPPSKTNSFCKSHHAPFSQLSGDLQSGNVADYVFITPNLCHDMHGASGCSSNLVKAGDDWLSMAVPPILKYLSSHGGVLFLTWDEGEGSTRVPFIAAGPGVKKGGHAGSIQYDHGSLVRSVEMIFGLSPLSAVSGKNHLGDLFQSGAFP
jgi:phospholipase C